MKSYGDFPVLLVRYPIEDAQSMSEEMLAILGAVKAHAVPVVIAKDMKDAQMLTQTHPELSAILIHWNDPKKNAHGLDYVRQLVRDVRDRGETIPIFLITEELRVDDLPHDLLSELAGTIWMGEDQPDFIAGRIERAVDMYHQSLMPPFFARLHQYVNEYNYSWHTPGHGGGVAFLKSPVGRVFYNFYGANTFLTDLCSSVPEMGSVLEHEGVVREAEEEAARAHGADRTYFVTNGTTMSNQIVHRGLLKAGDIVVIDRNCHKSILNACIMTGAIPVFLPAHRNGLGIIGPVKWSELEEAAIARRIEDNPLTATAQSKKPKLVVLTNSTYDGVLYNTETVLRKLSTVADVLHMDEAWIPYAPFHPLYTAYHGLTAVSDAENLPTVVTTTSTHKLLSALSQASMIHIRNGRKPIEHSRFNEAYMMHTSTSPLYAVIASLDVSTRMMDSPSGERMIEEAIRKALEFRLQVTKAHRERTEAGDWWFNVWQPDRVEAQMGTEEQESDPTRALQALSARNQYWSMKPDESWHRFQGIPDDYAMLDPVKVTITTPGIDVEGIPQTQGIPGPLVAAFLRGRGVVVEKNGFYNMLVLFTISITRGKASTLVSQLHEFKRVYDHNAPIRDALPDVYRAHPERYTRMGVRDLADAMHHFLRTADTGPVQERMYQELPTPVMTPTEAFGHLVDGNVEQVPLAQLGGRIAAVICLVYPPGIPVIVPGERFSANGDAIIDYMRIFQDWDSKFPGFEMEVQGVVRTKTADGRVEYSMYCVQ